MQEKLSAFHLTILIYMIQVGVVLLVLPRLLAERFGTNGWLALLIVSIVVTLNIALIAIVFRVGKGESIFDTLERSVPKWLLYPIYLFLIGVWSLIGCMTAKYYVLIFQMIAFPAFHPILFEIAYEVLVFLLAIKTVYNISKTATVFFWLVNWMLVLLFFFYGDFQWARLTPFIFRDSPHRLNDYFGIYSAFLGYELSLLLMPYCDQRSKFGRSVMIGNLYTTFNYVYICFIMFGFFGYQSLRHLQFPVLNLLAYLQLPFVQAMENLLYAFILNTTLITSTMYVWSAKEVSQRMFPVSNRLTVLVIVLLSLGIARIPDILSEVRQWLDWLSYIEVGVALGLPIVLVALIYVQKRKGAARHG